MILQEESPTIALPSIQIAKYENINIIGPTISQWEDRYGTKKLSTGCFSIPQFNFGKKPFCNSETRILFCHHLTRQKFLWGKRKTFYLIFYEYFSVLVLLTKKIIYCHDCCVFRPANRCSACRSLVEIDFLMLKQLFPSLMEQNKQKIKGVRVP